MNLTEPQLVWIQRVTGGAVGGTPTLAIQLAIAQDAEAVAHQKLRELHVHRAHQQVQTQNESIKAAFDFEVERVKGGKALKTLHKSGDARKALDTRHDTAIQSVDEARARLMMQAQSTLSDITGRLQLVEVERTVMGDGELAKEWGRLFTDLEIGSEVYTPLVRSRLLPENFVPDAYSETKAMLDATNDLYIEELLEAEETALDVELHKAAVQATGQTVKLLGLIPGIDSDTLEAATDLAVGLAESSLDVYADVMSKGGRASIVSGVLGAMGDAAANAVSGFSGLDPAVADSIATIIKAGFASAGSAVKAVQASLEPGADLEDVFPLLIDITTKAMDIGGEFDGSGGVSTASTVIGVLAKKAIEGKQSKLLRAMKAGKWGAVQDLLADATVEITEGLLDDDPSEALEDLELSGQAASLREALSGASMSDALLERTQEARQAMELMDAENAEDVLAAERERFAADLETLGQSEYLEGSELHSIQRMLKKLQRDRKIMESAAKVGGAGFAVASQFCSALAVGGTLLKFITELSSAVERAVHMRKWQEANKDALLGTSPYLSSIQNFVQNQAEQFAHHTIQAAMLLLQAGAQIASAAGISAPIAVAVEKSAMVVASVEDVLYKFHKKRDLARAWKLTLVALRDPKDRKAGLIVRGMNPTLAKYTIAYGATEAKDPIARQAVARIGLTAEVLAHKGSKVREVKAYLQELYDEDNVVIGKLPPGIVSWEKQIPDPILTLTTWTLTFDLAVRNGDLAETRAADVERALFELDRLQAACDEADEPEQAEACKQSWLLGLDVVRTALLGWTPKSTMNLLHKPMTQIVDVWVECVDQASV